jgi:hypothetical protein
MFFGVGRAVGSMGMAKKNVCSSGAFGARAGTRLAEMTRLGAQKNFIAALWALHLKRCD